MKSLFVFLQFLCVFVVLDNSLQHVNVAVSLVSFFSQVHFNEVRVAEGVVGGSPLCLGIHSSSFSATVSLSRCHSTVFVSAYRAHLLHGSIHPC